MKYFNIEKHLTTSGERMMKTLVFAVSTILILFSNAALSDVGLVVYRGADGELTEQSLNNLRELRVTAQKEKGIAIWVGFNIPFQSTPALRTPEVVAQEAASRDQLIEEIIYPLYANGSAWESSEPTLVTAAPGCLIMVSQAALRDLARNPKVKHIGHLPIE